MRGDAAVFLVVLGLFVAMEAAFAQNGDSRCKRPSSACRVELALRCADHLGSRAEALKDAAPRMSAETAQGCGELPHP